MHLRKLAAGLVAAFTLPLLPCMPAAAEGEYQGTSADGNFGYTLLEDGGISVYCENAGIESVEVPAAIDGYAVTALADGCFSESTGVTEVVLPDGLTVIGKGAFYGCENLAEVILPETVTVIGADAFYGCSALTEIIIPASVAEIGEYAFDTTEHLTAFTVDAANPVYSAQDGVLFENDGAALVKYPEARPDTSYTVPDSCTEIKNWAFIGAQNLEQLDLNQVTSIGEDAFYYCVKLRSIAVPEGVTELIGGAFCYCVELERVTLPSTLKSIGENCFYSCTSLTEVKLPEGLEKISGYAFFHCTSLQSINIPASVKTLVNRCIGYYYDEASAGEALQEGLTIHVTKDTPGYTYASSNDLTLETSSGNTLYYVLIGTAVVLIAVLAAAILAVLKKRKS